MTTTIDIADTRAKLKSKLGGLRRARGEALAGGKNTNKLTADIMACEAEIASLASGILTKSDAPSRKREQSHFQHAIAKELKDLARDYAVATKDAEIAARTLVDALNRAFIAGADLRDRWYRLTREPPHIASVDSELRARFGSRLSALLSTARGCRGRMGGLALPSAADYSVNTDWLIEERRALLKYIDVLVELHIEDSLKT